MLSANFRQAMNDRFHYDALVDDALRSVVRRVLTQVAEKGLPGSHHFYISFRSTDPSVQLPDYLRAKYPEEMTIVLQHQYWDLIIGAASFDVTVNLPGLPATTPADPRDVVLFDGTNFSIAFDGVAAGVPAARLNLHEKCLLQIKNLLRHRPPARYNNLMSWARPVGRF